MEHNAVRQPLIILAGSFLILCLLSLIPSNSILPKFMRTINVFSDIKKDTSKAKSKSIDSNQLLAKATLCNNLGIHAFGNANEKYNNFKKKLINCKINNTKVRIAYFGDSFIESDFITNDLRQLLQKKYGGDGIGFIPITTISPGMQKSIKHRFGKDWINYNLHNNKLNVPLGLSGYVFQSNEQSNVQFENPLTNNSFKEVYLYYGKRENASTLTLETDSSTKESIIPANSFIVNKYQINNSFTKNLKVTFPKDNTLLYGFSFENNYGVYIDNYSFRGSNGTHLQKLDSNYTTTFQQVNPYDLIILHYGINVIQNNQTKFDWYKKGFAKTIEWAKRHFPNAAILVISTSDKSTKTNGTFQTDLGIPILVDIQKQLAKENQVSFWNLYETMGGMNTMVDWAAQSPPLATKDHTHITLKGATKIANLLFQEIIK